MKQKKFSERMARVSIRSRFTPPPGFSVLKKVRARLLELGCEIRFGTTLDDFKIESQKLSGLILQGGETIDTNHESFGDVAGDFSQQSDWGGSDMDGGMDIGGDDW